MKKIIIIFVLLLCATITHAGYFEYNKDFPPEQSFFGKEAVWRGDLIDANDWNLFNDYLKMTFVNEYFLLKRIHYYDIPALIKHINLFTYSCGDECIDVPLTETIDDYLKMQTILKDQMPQEEVQK